MSHRVTLIPGDGTGPELTEVTSLGAEATGVGFDWDVQEAGVDVMETAGTPLPEETLAVQAATRSRLKALITTPIGTGFRSANVALRHEARAVRVPQAVQDVRRCALPLRQRRPRTRSREHRGTSTPESSTRRARA